MPLRQAREASRAGPHAPTVAETRLPTQRISAMQDETTGERAIQPMSELAPAIAEALAARDGGRIRSLVAGMQAPDLADLIELLDAPERVGFVETLGSAFDPEALSELEE